MQTQGQDFTTLLILVLVPVKYDGQETKVCAIYFLLTIVLREGTKIKYR